MAHPFRCWKPHVCASGGTLDGLFPRHAAQILSVERFLCPPMSQCLLYGGASRITCLLLPAWNGTSVRTSTGAGHRLAWGTPAFLRLLMLMYGLLRLKYKCQSSHGWLEITDSLNTVPSTRLPTQLLPS